MSSFGNTTTTTGSTTGTNTSSSMQQATPQDTAFMNSLYPQMSNLLALSQKPVYGQAQEANFLNKTNQAANSSLNGLASALAARGGNLNSGALATGAGNIMGQRAAAMGNYAMQTPLLNQQAQLSNGLQAMGMANALAGPALRGQIGGGTTSGTSNQTTEQSTGWGNMLMSGLGAAAGIATGGMTGGLGGLAKGIFGGGGSPASSYIGQQSGGFSNPTAPIGFNQNYDSAMGYGGGGQASW